MKLNFEIRNTRYPPLTFAHFIRFLCYYYLHDHVAYEIAIQLLFMADTEHCITKSVWRSRLFSMSTTLVGIAGQMMVGTDLLKGYFEFIAKLDPHNLTSAATRLRELIMDHLCDMNV